MNQPQNKTFNFFGEFTDPIKEKNFLNDQWRETKLVTLLPYVICCILLLLAGVIADYARIYVMGSANILTGMRVFQVLSSLVFFGLLYNTSEYPKAFPPFALFLSLQAAIIISALHFFTGFKSQTMFPGSLITTITFYVALQNNLRLTLIPAGILCLSYICFYDPNFIDPKHHLYLSFMMVSVNIIMFFFKVIWNKSSRLNYDLMTYHREVNKQKNKVMSIIGHDLKSPFTAISLQMQQAAYYLKKDNTDIALEKLNQVQGSVFKANALLESLMVWAISENKESLMNNDKILDTIKGALDHCRLQAEQKNITIDEDLTKEEFLHNTNMIATVVRNIISNSIKFTDPDGLIKVKAHMSTNGLTIEIQDNGHGMDKELIDNILLGDNQESGLGTSGEKGTGVGLQLVHDLIKRHGGLLKIDSEKGIGTTFRMIFERGEPRSIISN